MTTVLWACLRLKSPALAAIRRRLADPPAKLAITGGPVQRPTVVACSAPAAALGVRPGQNAAAARALCGDLVTVPRDPVAEEALRELLGSWAYGFSDQVTLDLPEAVALEIGGSLRLFSGWPAMARQLRDDLATLGIEATMAVAPRPRTAWALAEKQDGTAITRDDVVRRALDELPLATSGLDAAAVASLRAMGFLRLRELAAVPRDSLARRIGMAAVTHLDRLYGRAADPLPRWQPPDRFESVLEFDARPTAVEPLLFALRRLLNELCAFLQARDGGVQRFDLLLMHEERPVTRVPVGLLRPERDAVRLLELARARLERAVLPAPVAGLALVADELPPFRPVEPDLFTRARPDATDWPMLQERLRARLGDEAIRVPVERSDHRPECAGGLVPASGDSIPAAARAQPRQARRPQSAQPMHSASSTAQHRETQAASLQARRKQSASTPPDPALQQASTTLPAPSTSLPAASPPRTQSAASPHTPTAGTSVATRPASHAHVARATRDDEARALHQGARPIWLLPRPVPLRGMPARVLSGPERLESGWWDGGDLRRDYYVIETAQGQRAWVFRAPGQAEGWMLHGWFA